MDLIKFEDLKDLSKKEIEARALAVVNTYLNSGEEDSMDMLAKVVKLKDFIAVAEKALRGDLEGDFEQTYGKSYVKGGVTYTYSQGSKKLQYKVDDEYERLERELNERKELLKTAEKSSQPIYDGGGVQVPKVPVSYDKSSISIKY